MRVNSREKKFLVAGGAVAGSILIYFLLGLFMPSVDDLAGKVEAKKRLLLKQRETVAREDFYRARLEKYQQRLKQDNLRLLPGDNPSIAAAELQKLLKDIADQNGVEILRKDIQREQKLQDNIVKVPVRVETNCGPDQLVQFLVAVQNYEKSLTVDELLINSFRIQRRTEIRPSITVAGYIAVSEGQAGGKTAGTP